jgi:hypothetical protein
VRKLHATVRGEGSGRQGGYQGSKSQAARSRGVWRGRVLGRQQWRWQGEGARGPPGGLPAGGDVGRWAVEARGREEEGEEKVA